MKTYLGRHIFGVAAIVFGILTLVWHPFNAFQQSNSFGKIPSREPLIYIAAVAEIFGGLAMQSSKTARAGAIALGGTLLVFSLSWIPGILAGPKVYNNWNTFFEPFSQAAGAIIVCAMTGRSGSERCAKMAQFGYISFGICVISFTLEQIFYLANTASLVPKWLPPGQMFWAVTTTIAFALAAIALLVGYMSLLASRLLTAMFVGFLFLVWVPMCLAHPHSVLNWSETLETLSIAGAAWIIADYLSQKQSASRTA